MILSRGRDSYRVGIVCALAVEKAAIEAALDEEHAPLPRTPGDDNEYTFGRIGRHDVVVACLPAGSPGTVSAAAVANDMMRSFHIEIGLMVGIGGGVWSERSDVRLGDVVVGKPDGQHGGVVRWDFGKREDDYAFRRTGMVNKPPRWLMAALANLQTKHWRRGNELGRLADDMLAANPHMAATFGHQGVENDELFEAAYPHPSGESTCAECDRSRLVSRPQRPSNRPLIHYGGIASGNAVMKHGPMRDRIAQKEGVLCFEMEVAGLVEGQFPCIVIRGICDYSDSHRNKRWRPYAAANAAAFAKEFLAVIEPILAVSTDSAGATPVTKQPPLSLLGSDGGKNGRTVLQTLWPVATSSSSPKVTSTVDIVAIHGTTGDLYTTWTERSKNRLWLRDFLHNDISDAHILTFGYDPAAAFGRSVSGIEDLAISLLEGLVARRRRAGTEGNPLVFICHNLGSIIFKKAVVLAQNSKSQYADLHPCIKGAVFLGAPHGGPDIEYWEKILGNLVNLPLKSPLRSDLLYQMRLKSDVLGQICDQFADRAVLLRIFTIYEKLRQEGLDHLIVDKDSAVVDLPNETILPTQASHLSMCRFRSSEEDAYMVVSECLVRLVEFSKGTTGELYDGPARHIRERLNMEGDISGDFLRKLPRPSRGTNSWVLEDDAYRNWLGPRNCRLLWLHGLPGVGKTLLAKFVIDRLRKPSAEPEIVTCFFFSRKNSGSRNLRSFIRETVRQLLEADSSLVVHMPKKFWHSSDIPSEKDCVTFMNGFLRAENGPRIRIIIDGLDEAEESCAEELAQLIVDLLSEDYFHRLGILITDRRRPPFDSVLQLSTQDLGILEVSGGKLQSDVAQHVREKLEPFFVSGRIPPAVGEEVEQAIIRAAHGTFLHANLLINAFIGNVKIWDQATVRAQIAHMERLTPTLESLYCELLSQIPGDVTQQAVIMFALVRVCVRPLHVNDLLHAIALANDPDLASLDELTDNIPFNLAHDIPQFSGYLLEVTAEGFVQFAHKSALDTFNSESNDPSCAEILSAFRTPTQECHRLLALACFRLFRLRDLRLPHVKNVLLSSPHPLYFDRPEGEVLMQSAAKHPFLLYAITYWDAHFRQLAPDDGLIDNLVDWITTKDGVYMYHCRRVVTQLTGSGWEPPTHISGMSREEDDIRIPALHMLQELGDFPRATKILISRGYNVNEVHALLNFGPDDRRQTPLCCAVRQGRVASAQLLLNIEEVSLRLPYKGTSPLHWALRTDPEGLTADQLRLLEILFADPRASMYATDGKGWTPLYCFFQYGSPQASQQKDRVWNALTAAGALRKDNDSGTSQQILAQAFRYGTSEEYVLQLLRADDANTDADMIGVNLHEALEFVQLNDWHAVESELFTRFPLHFIKEILPDGFSVLTKYAYMGRKAQVLSILAAIPESERSPSLDTHRWNFLSLCAHQDWRDVVDHARKTFNASFSSSDHFGRTSLHWAAENGWAFHDLYFEEFYKPTLDQQDRDGNSALHIAVTTTNVIGASWLLNQGASYLLPDKYGRNAAHLAAEHFSREILVMLLETPTREFKRDHNGRSLLHYLSKWSDLPFLEDFCARKAPIIDVKDRDRRTPLHYAALCSNTDSADVLLELGANPNALDRNGFSPFHYALRNKNSEIVIKLMECGANVSILSGFCQTTLQMAAVTGHEKIVERLLRERYRISHRDSLGRSLIYEFCRGLSNESLTDRMSKPWHGWILDLKAEGANVNVSDLSGRSPLHLAVLKGDRVLVSLLLDYLKAGTSLPDEHGCSPLDWAEAAGFYEIAKILRSAGACNTADWRGKKVMRSYWRPVEVTSAEEEERLAKLVVLDLATLRLEDKPSRPSRMNNPKATPQKPPSKNRHDTGPDESSSETHHDIRPGKSSSKTNRHARPGESSSETRYDDRSDDSSPAPRPKTRSKKPSSKAPQTATSDNFFTRMFREPQPMKPSSSKTTKQTTPRED